MSDRIYRTQDDATQVSQDQRDAARYRWLRDKSEPNLCAFYLSVGMALHGVKFKPETVDEAIDAAMQAESRTDGVSLVDAKTKSPSGTDTSPDGERATFIEPFLQEKE